MRNKVLIYSLRIALVFGCAMQSSCIFTGLVSAGVSRTADPRLELSDTRGPSTGYYVGLRVIDGIEHFAVAVPGLLEDRSPEEVMTFFLPRDHNKPTQEPKFQFGKALERREAQARQETHASLDDRPTVAFELLSGTGEVAPEDPPPERDYPTWLRVYVREDSQGLFAYYHVDGQRHERTVTLDLPYEVRSAFFVGAQKSLYFITVPVDFVLFPIVFPLVLLFGALTS